MAGTITGGQKAAQTNKEIHGEDFYKNIGKIGAEKYKEKQAQGIAKPRGFAYNRDLAREAGRLGGQRSKRK